MTCVGFFHAAQTSSQTEFRPDGVFIPSPIVLAREHDFAGDYTTLLGVALNKNINKCI